MGIDKSEDAKEAGDLETDGRTGSLAESVVCGAASWEFEGSVPGGASCELSDVAAVDCSDTASSVVTEVEMAEASVDVISTVLGDTDDCDSSGVPGAVGVDVLPIALSESSDVPT